MFKRQLNGSAHQQKINFFIGKEGGGGNRKNQIHRSDPIFIGHFLQMSEPVIPVAQQQFNSLALNQQHEVSRTRRNDNLMLPQAFQAQSGTLQIFALIDVLHNSDHLYSAPLNRTARATQQEIDFPVRLLIIAA
ncbi:hypothetical protein D3C81_1456050 [compost metagenome]